MYGKEQNTKGAGGKKDRHTKERERKRQKWKLWRFWLR